MEIKILGTGCPNCRKLEKETENVVSELGLDATVTKVEDIMKIMEYGILRTPGLVVDEKVIVSGRVPGREELKKLIINC
jgi:small redox-active disulfide protein 2